MKRLFFLFVLLWTGYSCTKTEEVYQEDKTPLNIKIENELTILANNKEIILAATVSYLPEGLEIVEHGFAISKNGQAFDFSLMEKYPIKEAPKPGKIEYKLPDISFAKFNETYSYCYYITTKDKNYATNIKSFQLSKFIVNYKNLQATADEEINLTGDFSQLNNEYGLVDSKERDISFTKKDNYTLTFKMPDYYSHGDNINFYFKNLKDNSEPLHYCTAVEVLGSIFAPANTIYKLSDNLKLQGKNLSRGVRVIVGNREMNYYNELSLHDFIYDQYGDNFSIGYDNGRDRVIFPKKIELQKIPNDAIIFAEQIAHPNSYVKIKPSTVYEYVSYPDCLLGGKRCVVTTTWDAQDNVLIGDIEEDGEYPIILQSPHLKYQSNSRLKVETLKFKEVSASEVYNNEKIMVKANFIPNKEYFALVGDFHADITVTKPGEGYFNNPQISAGTKPLYIGYNLNNFLKQVKIPTGVSIVTKEQQAKIEFNPKRATANDRVKVNITGINSSILFIGSVSVLATLEGNSLYFYIPPSLPKGKYKLSMISSLGYELKLAESDDYIEIY